MDYKDDLKKRLPDYLSSYRSIDISQKRNFRCLNPAHEDSDPSMGYDAANLQVHCFGCGARYDLFDLIGLDEGLPGYPEQYRRACEIFNYPTTGPGEWRPEIRHQALPEEAAPPEGTRQRTEAIADYREDYARWHANIKKTEYLHKRGLTDEVINRFNLGYAPTWKHPDKPNTPASPRIIIPTSASSYIARAEDETNKYRYMMAGPNRLLNDQALYEAGRPVFIVEGALDALSIIAAGGEAVALNSTSMAKTLISQVKRNAPAHPLIIAMDNDQAGEDTAQTLAEGFRGAGILFYRPSNLYGESKDANEALQRDREGFQQAIREAEEAAQEEADRENQAAREAHLQNNARYRMAALQQEIRESTRRAPISTGFNNLDNLLDGGLRAGLYVIGAIPSLGKTTYVLQMADQIAQEGQDVLIFSLEMEALELMSKSISRHTIKDGYASIAKTNIGILDGSRYEKYSAEEHDHISECMALYSQYSEHIYIFEGRGTMGTAEIRATVEEHMRHVQPERAPVIIVDYLQILWPEDPRATDKQNADKAVVELKRISRDYKAPVIVVSSFNRENYNRDVSMASFKESGGIEYSADVLLGLQFRATGTNDKGVPIRPNADEAKKKNPRELEIKVLKNRSGRTGNKVGYDYFALFNYFEEYDGLEYDE